VAFAEVDKFIDTPVKHYSSGMYVRLAFAVAAHLEPEILLVDEVLGRRRRFLSEKSAWAKWADVPSRPHDYLREPQLTAASLSHRLRHSTLLIHCRVCLEAVALSWYKSILCS